MTTPLETRREEVRTLSPRVEALDVLVELLSDLDSATRTAEFYNRLCEAVCRMTTMERAVLFLYDEAVRHVVALGCHGIDPALLVDVHGRLEEAPVAQRALSSDQVIEVSETIENELPARYAQALGLNTLTCTPMSAAGQWFGVIFADRGGGRFKLTDGERHAMWTLGKLAALAASAQLVTREQEEARGLTQQIDLAREIHEQVVQRLFGVSLVLSSEIELPPEDRDRCRTEIREALADLRTALERPLAPRPRETGTTLRAELSRLSRHHGELPLAVSWPEGGEVPEAIEPLAQAVLREALRNARKHARPSRIDVRVGFEDGAFVLEVVNDGLREAPRGAGMGLKLAVVEALHLGGVVEFGRIENDHWRVRLVVPDGDE